MVKHQAWHWGLLNNQLAHLSFNRSNHIICIQMWATEKYSWKWGLTVSSEKGEDLWANFSHNSWTAIVVWVPPEITHWPRTMKHCVNGSEMQKPLWAPLHKEDRSQADLLIAYGGGRGRGQSSRPETLGVEELEGTFPVPSHPLKRKNLCRTGWLEQEESLCSRHSLVSHHLLPFQDAQNESES